MKEPRRFLVTGATGFLGGHCLAEVARRGWAARALARRRPTATLPGDPEVVEGELGDPPRLAAAVEGVTDVIHLAARVHRMQDDAEDPLAAFRRTNVEGTRRLVEAAAAAGVRRILLASTVKAIGEETEGEFDERSPCRPSSPYGISKLEAEDLLLGLAETHGLHAVVLRLPMVYGPGNKGNVLRLLDAAAAGRRLPFGRIENRRSMAYAANVVAAALAALDSDRSRGQVYLVADAEPYSTRELYAAICRAMGKKPLLVGVPPSLLTALGRLGGWAEKLLGRPLPVNPEVVRRLTGDLRFRTEKIHRHLGFVPQVGLEEGIARTVAWYLGREAEGQSRSDPAG